MPPIPPIPPMPCIRLLGTKNRAIAQTNMNEHSSRSHTIFQLTVEQEIAQGQPGDPPVLRKGKAGGARGHRSSTRLSKHGRGEAFR